MYVLIRAEPPEPEKGPTLGRRVPPVNQPVTPSFQVLS